jgi:preprotein translocase subunit SecD
MIQISRWKIIAIAISIVFGVLFTLPNALPQSTLDALPAFMPKQKLNLGLDLQGGSHLLLEVDVAALRAERMTNVIEDVRTTLREQNIVFSDLGQRGDAISVTINDPTKVAAATTALKNRIGAPLAGAVGGRDINIVNREAQRIELVFAAEALNADASKAVDQSIETIRRRIDSLGTKEPTIIRQGVDRIVVQAPGESDPERLKAVIGQTAKLSFQMVDETVTPEDVQAGRAPPGVEILPSEDGYSAAYALRRRAVVSGEMLTDANQTFDSQTGKPEVAFRFNGVGARRFGDATSQNVGKRFAIVLDKKVISAPVINGPIPGGSGVINGSFTAESANNLAILLRSGALPAPLTVEEQRTVGAELGADSIRAGVISLAIGGAAIVVFIILAYGLFGIFAAIALIINVLLIFGMMSLTQATLTFPGIAGLILTLAVAVDANVLIYERIRDESHDGRPVISAIDHGYSRALVSILDANITSAISAIIMLWLGAGPVRGFAWTLLIGVITSVFTSVVITQVLVVWWYRLKRPKTLPMA